MSQFVQKEIIQNTTEMKTQPLKCATILCDANWYDKSINKKGRRKCIEDIMEFPLTFFFLIDGV